MGESRTAQALGPRASRGRARCRLALAALAALLAAGPARAQAPAANRSAGCAAGRPQVGAPDEAPQTAAGLVQPRASDFVRPNHYTLRLKLDPTKRRFSGQLMVALDVGAAANSSGPGARYLTLHAGANIQIRKAFYVFTARANLQIPATSIGRDLAAELLTLDFHPNHIDAGPGLLLLVYGGGVNETDSHGLFVHRSNRPRRNGPAAPAAPAAPDGLGLATQMQPSFARRLFPGWDEPQLKARFALIVVLPFRGYECISNMPVKRKSISLSCSGEPLQEVEFHTSPAMSSYLLTLVVGRFERAEALTASQCRLRVHFYAAPAPAADAPEPAPAPGRRQAAQLALELAVKTFDRLERRLGVKYPLSKFDMVALRDFAGGAMENWGAAIFHENYLLFDNSSQQGGDVRVGGAANRPRRLVVPLVVAHEIAHQWFGNLVTPSSWRFLWLSEGFAQLLMYEVANELLPGSNYRQLFLEDSRQSALHEDELLTSGRALEPRLAAGQELAAADQLELFDQLTYNKGAALLHNLQLVLGRDQFAAGLRHYLQKHSYASVESRDLWRALEEAGGRPAGQLEPLMADWLRLDGLPLVSVQAEEAADHYSVRLAQERFTLLPAGLQANASQHWRLLVTLASELRPAPAEAELRLWAAAGPELRQPQGAAGSLLLLAEPRASFRLAKATTGRWFKLNVNATGYFRVDYAAPAGPQLDMWARLRPAVRAGALNALERFNLHDDLFAMTLGGRKSLVFYLRRLLDTFDQEPEPLVLRPIVGALERVRLVLVSNSAQEAELGALFERFVGRYLRQLAARPLGEPAAELLEASLLQFGEAESAGRAQAAFARLVLARPAGGARAAELPASRELRAAVYAAGLGRAGAQSELAWRRLLELYESAESSGPERPAICQALGSAREPARLAELLRLALGAAAPHVRPQDAALLLESMSQGRAGRELLWAQLVNGSQALAARQLLAPAVRSLARGLVESAAESAESAGASSAPGAESFGQLELQLRQLYASHADEHGKLIGQSVEWLRINTQWFRRDHDELARFLRAWAAPEAPGARDPPTSDQ